MSECDNYCGHGDNVRRSYGGQPVVGGQPMRRISTVAKAADDTRNLTLWAERNVARGLSLNDDLLQLIRAAGDDDKQVNEACRQAEDRVGSNSAANRGTALHALVHRVNRGIELPEGLDSDTIASLDAYRRQIDRLGLTPVMSEQFVACEAEQIAGTFDVLLVDRDGVAYVADVKTGAKSWERTFTHATAVQLAGYQRGRRWCPVNGWLAPHGADSGLGLLISLPVGKGVCHIDTVDIRAGSFGLDVSLAVLEWRDTKGLARAFPQEQ